MLRRATACTTIAALLCPALSGAQAYTVPTPVPHQWDGPQTAYEPRLVFLAEIKRWTQYWSGLFPEGQEPPTPSLKQLGGELAQFKTTASAGMTVDELARAKSAFKQWQARFGDELCAVPALAQGGADCKKAAQQIGSAAQSASSRLQEQEKQRIAALSAALSGTPAPALFDNAVSAPPLAREPGVAARVAAPRPALPAVRRGAPSGAVAAAVPTPPDAADASDVSLIDRLVSAIKRAAPWEWDGFCLRYVWNALAATLQTNVRATLGGAARSAHHFLKAVKKAPDLLAKIDLRAIDPFDSDGTLKLQKGMMLFYDRSVCGFDADYGHGEIVTEVDASGASGRATSSNVENVRTSCLSRALKRGLAMVVMPGQSPAPVAAASTRL